jgi:hypothetical protein
MRVIDPLDGKTPFESVRAVVRKYTALLGADALAAIVDIIGNRPDFATPAAVMTITGTGASQRVAHGLKDPDGKPAKPRAWAIQRFKACTEIDIQAVDDTNVTCEITNKGEVTIALFL